MKNFSFFSLFLCLCIFQNGQAQTQDNLINTPGDIAFVGYYYNGPSGNNEGFSFVLMDNCPAGTSIRFDDEEWIGDRFESANREGQILWVNNTNTTIPSGTVITITNPSNNTDFPIFASTGLATEDNAGFVLTPDDQIYAYIGERSNPEVFLAFIGEEASLSVDNATLSGTGLIDGQTALVINNGGFYSGTTDCQNEVANCTQFINNEDQWTLGDFDFLTGIANFFSNTENETTLNIPNIEVEAVEVELHPLPATHKIYIHSAKKVSLLQLFDSYGRPLRVVPNQNEISVSQLNTGIYLLKLTIDNETVIKQIVKQ